MSDRDIRVVVVGASVAGLALAVCLEQANIDYVLLEREKQIGFLKQDSLLELPPNGLRILDELGVLDRLGKQKIPATYETHFGFNGKQLVSFDPYKSFRENGEPLVTYFEKKDLLQGLRQSLNDESKIVSGKSVVSYSNDEHGITVRTADGSSFQGDILVGADGFNGTVKSLLLKEIAQAGESTDSIDDFSSEYKCLSATSPFHPIDHDFEFGHTYSSHFNGYLTSVIAASRNRMHWYLFVPSIPTTKVPNLPIFSTEEAEKYAQAYSEAKMCQDFTVGDVWNTRLQSSLSPIIEGVMKKWSHGRVVLMGNAVHQLSEQQVFRNSLHGTNLSIEEAVVLTNELHASLHPANPSSQPKPESTPTDPSTTTPAHHPILNLTSITELFSKYQSAQLPRAELVQSMSRQMMDMYISTTAPIMAEAMKSGIYHFGEKAKNPRTARILKAREPQLIEPTKRTLLLHGPKCPQPLHHVLKTIHALTKPHSILFNKKNENIHPFENTESLEFLAGKNECGIVVFGSSNKKRPNCVTVVRIFDGKVLDMCEMMLLGAGLEGQGEAESEKQKESMRKMQLDVGVGMKPMMLFAGSAWEDSTSPVYGMVKSMMLDMFAGDETDKIDVEGLQYLLMVAAEEPVEGTQPVIHLRWYKLRTKKSGQKLPRVELDEVGPKFDFRIGRVREAEAEAMKEAMKQGKRPNEEGRTKKNISMDTIGDKIGRVHLGRQDLTQLQTRKMKGLKRRAGVEDEDEGDVDMMDVDEISEDDTRKKARVD
ncbi:rRNA-binding ribosome biosynthesis protein rpf2 [Onygenales sp. PD_40]|nr:rRNA-binding ribosome biosynthesis protein rpf2 [Onygenales sp. PD_40]